MPRRAGVYGMPFDQVGGGQLHQALIARVLSSAYDVDLIHHVPGLSHERLAEDYGLDLGAVRLRYVEPFTALWPYATEDTPRGADPFQAHRALTEGYDVFVDTVMGPPIRSYAKRGVLVVLFPAGTRASLWPWSEPPGRTPLLKRLARDLYYRRRWRAAFSSYDRCVANSAFTAGWIAERWGLEAEVVYPPVRARFEQRPKAKQILSVGRFSRRGTRKCQLEMVKAFTDASPALPAGWEYVCLGGVAPDVDDRGYFEEVREAAAGHPVRLLANPSDEVIREAYERASVFWHAAGYGQDERLHPERLEHFGMSTVEAMAAGCVPVVIRRGGQPEIVQQGLDGYLWDTLDELVTYTRTLAAEPELRQKMADGARARAQKFTSLEDFEARMLRIIG